MSLVFFCRDVHQEHKENPHALTTYHGNIKSYKEDRIFIIMRW